jgi:signal transduction histidine kinase
MSAQFLETAAGMAADPDTRDSLRDIDDSVERMRQMLGELVQVTKAQRDFVTMAPQQMTIADLTNALRRRLRALVYGRDIRASATSTRDVPEQIEVDPLALDRIIDNLITNAAKYTERGSIVVELDGAPGYLVIRVSDTGRGIAPDAMDLMSRFGAGTTFWVYLPLAPRASGRLALPESGAVELPAESSSPLLSRVVRIRRLTA